MLNFLTQTETSHTSHHTTPPVSPDVPRTTHPNISPFPQNHPLNTLSHESGPPDDLASVRSVVFVVVLMGEMDIAEIDVTGVWFDCHSVGENGLVRLRKSDSF
jgi:hypothetical protein